MCIFHNGSIALCVFYISENEVNYVFLEYRRDSFIKFNDPGRPKKQGDTGTKNQRIDQMACFSSKHKTIMTFQVSI